MIEMGNCHAWGAEDHRCGREVIQATNLVPSSRCEDSMTCYEGQGRWEILEQQDSKKTQTIQNSLPVSTKGSFLILYARARRKAKWQFGIISYQMRSLDFHAFHCIRIKPGYPAPPSIP